MPLAWGGKEATIANIAYQLLVALLERLAEVVEDRVADLGISLRLLGNETNDVAPRLASRPSPAAARPISR